MVKSFQADGVSHDMGTVVMDMLIVLRPDADRASFALPGTGAGEVAEPEEAGEPPLSAASEAPNSAPEENHEDQDNGLPDVRQSLQNILLRQAELLEQQRTACLQEILTGPSPVERAAEFASAYSEMKLLQRIEDSSFRQVWRLTDLFIKLKGAAPERKKMKMPPQDSDPSSAPAPAAEAPKIAPKTSPMNPQGSHSRLPAASERDPAPPPPPASTH